MHVVNFPKNVSGYTADEILQACLGKHEDVIILGLNYDNDLTHMTLAASAGTEHPADINWNLDGLKQLLLSGSV